MPFFLNYRSFGSSLEVQYASLQQSTWSIILLHFTKEWSGNAFFIGIMVLMVLLIPGFLDMVFRGSMIGICYIILGQSSLVNADRNAVLSPPQAELVQIQEELCKVDLKKKPDKITDKWSLTCKKISSLKYWFLIYYLIIIIGFCINLSP